MLRAQTMDHRRWVQQNEAREKLRWAWREFFDEYDVLVAPIMATAAFPHDQSPMGSRTIDVDGSPRPYFEQVFWAGLPGVAYLPATVIPTGNNAAGCRSACRSSVPHTAIDSPSALRGCSKPKGSRSRLHPPTPEFTAEHHDDRLHLRVRHRSRAPDQDAPGLELGTARALPEARRSVQRSDQRGDRAEPRRSARSARKRPMRRSHAAKTGVRCTACR